MSTIEPTTTDASSGAVIFQRLNVVADELKAALEAPDRPKHFHRLRVAIRRARIATKLLGQQTQLPRSKKIKRALRSLFQGAGGVRECDVALNRLSERLREADDGNRIALEVSMVWVMENRSEAIDEFRKMAHKRRRKFCDQVEKTNDLLHVNADDREAAGLVTPDEFKCAALEVVAGEIDRFKARTELDLSSHESAHRLRVRCKKLRYALEIAELGVADERLRLLISRLTELQDELGSIHDWHESASLLKNHAARARRVQAANEDSDSTALASRLEALAQSELQHADESLREFNGKWQANVRSEVLTALETANEASPCDCTSEPLPENATSSLEDPVRQ
jgi:CHAD domain-containing protein